MTDSIATSQTILVVGGGISGMTAALEAAECGKQVMLIERNATLGGRTSLLYRYFPKMCHPTCGLEINLRRLKGNRNVRVMTMTQVVSVIGSRGDYTVTLKVAPRYVNDHCTGCGDCAKAVEAEIDNPYEYGLAKTKAAYLPHAMAYPQRYVIDASIINTPDGEKALAAWTAHDDIFPIQTSIAWPRHPGKSPVKEHPCPKALPPTVSPASARS